MLHTCIIFFFRDTGCLSKRNGVWNGSTDAALFYLGVSSLNFYMFCCRCWSPFGFVQRSRRGAECVFVSVFGMQGLL